jgi:hypothetical protein
MNNPRKFFFELALIDRMRRDYQVPQQAAVDPEALTAPEDPRNAVIRILCDKAIRALRAYKAEPEERSHLIEVTATCELMRQLGYRAVADLGKINRVVAHRINLKEAERLAQRAAAALETISEDALNESYT